MDTRFDSMAFEEFQALSPEEAYGIYQESIAALQESVAELSEKLAIALELIASLSSNSTNSSKPPSSDPPYSKPAPKSLREKTGKKQGGQKGHKGHSIRIPENALLAKAVHLPQQCAGCPEGSSCPDSSVAVRRSIEIPMQPIVVEHSCVSRACPKLGGAEISGAFPYGINSAMQYGPCAEAFAVMLNTVGAVSYSRASMLIRQAFGLSLSPSSIKGFVSKAAKLLNSEYEAIAEALKAQPAIAADETSIRAQGKLYWLHNASTEKLSHFSAHPKRGSEAMDAAGILPSCSGIVAHDCFSPYFRYEGALHALCCQHLLRELKWASEQPGQAWAEKMASLLTEMNSKKKELMARGKQQAGSLLYEAYECEYYFILSQARLECPEAPKSDKKRGRKKKGKLLSLIDRLEKRQAQYMLFFENFKAPFTSSQAERDIRVAKVKGKVSGGMRTAAGAQEFAQILSCIYTANKNGLNIFEFMASAFSGKALSLGV
ncbi:MAG: IS66 family transposase [Eubacteriaceae bacterium]|nr:IS66 family transposase [Eubacteriaceae bacterium]